MSSLLIPRLTRLPISAGASLLMLGLMLTGCSQPDAALPNFPSEPPAKILEMAEPELEKISKNGQIGRGMESVSGAVARIGDEDLRTELTDAVTEMALAKDVAVRKEKATMILEKIRDYAGSAPAAAE